MHVHPFVDAEWDRLTVAAVTSPENFAVTEPINLTQRRYYGTEAQPLAATLTAEHGKVVALLRAQAVEVLDLAATAGLPYQFNVRDAAATIGSRLLLMRMRREIRAPEPALAASRLGLDGAPEVAAGAVEGGDVIVGPTELLVGIGERTDEPGLAALRSLLRAGREVIPIRLAAGTLHLDVALNLLGPRLGLIHRPSIAQALPEALRKVEWIEVTDQEFAEQAVNMLVLDPVTVVMDARHERLAAELARRGFRCLRVNLDEITKVGGGVRYMVLPLVRLRADDAR
jgi:N-dimethylarginine dimethylaminohydrolase